MTRERSGLDNSWIRGGSTLLVLNCLLLLPSWILHGFPGPHLFALEAGIVAGLFLLVPRRRWTGWAAGVAGASVVVLFLLLLADTAARMSLARPLNLYLDLQLVSAVANLLDGNLGQGWGVVILSALGAAGLGVTLLLARVLPRLAPPPQPADRRSRWWLPGAALLAVSVLLIPLRWVHPTGVAFALPATRLVQEQSTHLSRMLVERERFAVEMASAPEGYRPGPGFLNRLGGRDVILAFIESYGISAVRDPRYAPILQPRLEAMEAAVETQGLHLATGLLEAPSQGGMSWLGHGSVLSGLWLDNQLRYDLLMASERPTLVDDFEAAGYRTAAIMPAITLAWPEGERLGYDEVWAFKDIGYAGPPLNWVTMPDQFTWSFMQHSVRRAQDDGRPIFVELGLISSHAPWTPILDVIPEWDRIGDGGEFQRWAEAGEAPEELWRDSDRVREHYARSVAYAVDVLSSYAQRYLDDGALIIALGDHQPAPLITGEEASRAVPVHVLAASPTLLEPFLEWGFAPGAVPPEDSEVRRMDAFRHWFVAAFSEPAPLVAQQ